MRKYIHKLLSVIFLISGFTIIHAQQLVEDAEMEDEQLSRVETTSSLFENFNRRIFTISTFNYSPLKSGVNQGSQLSFMEEKSATTELSLELTFNNLKYLAGRLDVQALYSTLYSTGGPIFEKDYNDKVGLNEAFLDIYSAHGFSVLAGKYRRIFSPGIFENPMDRHNSMSAQPGDPLVRSGVWVFTVSQTVMFAYDFFSQLTVQAAVLPDFAENKFGIPVKNYEPVLVKKKQSPQPLFVFERGSKSWTKDDMDYFVRLYFNIFKGDLNFIYYYLNQDFQPGVSYSRYLGNYIEFHGEVIHYKKPDKAFSDLAVSKSDYFDYLLGSRFDISNEFGFVAEYLHQDDRPDKIVEPGMKRQLYLLGILNTLSDGGIKTPLKDYGMLSMHYLQLDDRYDFFINGIYGFAHKEAIFSIRASDNVNDNLKLSMMASLPYGDDQSHYGAFFPYEYTLAVEVNGAF